MPTHDIAPPQFPTGFLFGTAQSAHQVEGGNTNSDWWRWEHQEGSRCREPSGDACDFYNRYREDIGMAAGFGFNAFRFSVEWARIEPAEGEFSSAVLDHYRRVLAACREQRLAPMVTFHHFTLPLWLADAGGLTSDRFPALFARYCDRTAAALGDLMSHASTFNEPESRSGAISTGACSTTSSGPSATGPPSAWWRSTANASRGPRSRARTGWAGSRGPVA